MSKLRDGIGETIHLARLDGTDVLYLATRFSHHALNVRFEIGRRLPAYSTALGKAMLSELPRGELPDHVPSTFTAFTPKTIRSKSELFAALVDVRRQGYAEDDEEGSLGLYCLAVALSHPDLPLSAVSCSIPKVRIADHDLKGITMALLEAKRHVLARLRPLPMLGADR